MKNLNILPFLAIFFTKLYADDRIIIYLRHSPESIVNQAIKEDRGDLFPNKNKQKFPSKTIKKRIKGMQKWLTPKLSGFMAIYAGFMDISNRDGLISFPLRHVTPKITIAITEKINLVKVKENTISHREFLPQDQAQVKLYTYERKEDIDPQDPAKKTLYWNVQETPIPADNKINSLTLVILSKPSNLFVPTGDFMAVESNHLVLPEIYVIGNRSQANILFQTLDIRQYFEPITTEDKKENKNKKSLIKNI